MLKSYQSIKTSELFDGESWAYGTDLPEGRLGHAFVSYTANEILLFSGFNYKGLWTLATTFMYDFSAPNIGWVKKIRHASGSLGSDSGTPQVVKLLSVTILLLDTFDLVQIYHVQELRRLDCQKHQLSLRNAVGPRLCVEGSAPT